MQRYLPGFKPSLPFPNVDGWPVLNTGHPGRAGYMSGWIHRRLYPDAESALVDARLAVQLTGISLYVIELEVPASFRKYWPEDHNWQIREEPPFHGQVGDFYYPRPNYYAIEPNALISEVFTPGEKTKN